MPFERYEGPLRPTRPGLSTTLQPSGKVTLSEQAAGDMGQATDMAMPEAIELYFDREQQIVGLRAVPRGTPHSYTARKQKHGATVVFSALSFFNHYGIDLGGVSRRFPAYMEGDILCVDLKGRPEIITGPRTLERTKHTPTTSEGDQSGEQATDTSARTAVE